MHMHTYSMGKVDSNKVTVTYILMRMHAYIHTVWERLTHTRKWKCLDGAMQRQRYEACWKSAYMSRHLQELDLKRQANAIIEQVTHVCACVCVSYVVQTL
jgi:hypothetical protein